MSSQFMPMGTGAFDVALDIDLLKDAIINHQCQCKNVLASHADGSMAPGQVAMTPYDMNSPTWSESSFKGKLVASLVVNGGEDPTNFSFLGYGQSPLGAGSMLPAGLGPQSPSFSPMSLQYSPISPSFSSYPVDCSITLCPEHLTDIASPIFPTYPPASPAHLPTSPQWSPSSPAQNGMAHLSPVYSPASPQWSPSLALLKMVQLTFHLHTAQHLHNGHLLALLKMVQLTAGTHTVHPHHGTTLALTHDLITPTPPTTGCQEHRDMMVRQKALTTKCAASSGSPDKPKRRARVPAVKELPSLQTIHQIKEVGKQTHLQAMKTRETYSRHVHRACSWLQGHFPVEGTPPILSHTREESEIYSDPGFKSAFEHMPNQCSDKVLALYLSWRGFQENCSQSTIDGI
ncbi:hypothetical protein EDC04DRAFT_2609980 [Pisolithus marmoratus]|nr:hypothetical protein EDC04DRAFT_2609980 [Pisolithus marmoratus]